MTDIICHPPLITLYLYELHCLHRYAWMCFFFFFKIHEGYYCHSFHMVWFSCAGWLLYWISRTLCDVSLIILLIYIYTCYVSSLSIVSLLLYWMQCTNLSPNEKFPSLHSNECVCVCVCVWVIQGYHNLDWNE